MEECAIVERGEIILASSGEGSSSSSFNDQMVTTVFWFFIQVCFFLVFMIPCLIAIGIILLGYIYDWRARWFLLFGCIFTLFFSVTGDVQIYIDVLANVFLYLREWVITLPTHGFQLGERHQPLFDYIPYGLQIMIPASIGFGTLLGGIGLWLVLNRPELLRLPIRKPRKAKKKKATYKKSLPHIKDGVAIGHDEKGNAVFLKDAELNMHTFVVGATGAGKTNTMLVILESAIRRGKPIIVVDGKGDPDMIEDLAQLCSQHDREFQSFSYQGTTHYNPLSHGDETELKDKLIAAEEWSETYYKRAAERYLQLVFQIMRKKKIPIDLVEVQKLLDTKKLMKELKSTPFDKEKRDEYKDYINGLDAGHKSAIDGLKDRLALITESKPGVLFQEDENAIDLLEAVIQKKVILMSLSGLSYSSFTPALGSMIVEDLKTVAAAITGRGKDDYTFVVLDEFNLFAGEQVVNMINKSRSAGFCCLIATQELADLATAGGDELVAQVIGNTNVKIIHRQDVPDSAEYLAGVVGTEKIYQKTLATEESLLGNRPTGTGSVQDIDEYIISPNILKTLGRGEAVVVKKLPNLSVDLTQVQAAKGK